jgi:hypothetical protein
MCVLDTREGPVYEAPTGDIGRDGRHRMQADAWLTRNRAPIGAAVGAVLVTAAALYLHSHPWLDPDRASWWKHTLATTGAALALAGSIVQGGKSRARAKSTTVRDEESRFFHHVSILWGIVALGAALALVSEILDL